MCGVGERVSALSMSFGSIYGYIVVGSVKCKLKSEELNSINLEFGWFRCDVAFLG